MTKKWYASKTVWVNLIGFVSAILVATGVIQVDLAPETIALILTVVNFILRLVTKEQIDWSSN